MKTIEITIEGISPLLMHNINIADLDKSAERKTKQYSVKDDAEKAAYWTIVKGKRQLYIPARNLYSAIIRASSYFKIKGRNLKPIIAGSIRIEPNEILLGTDKYEIDIQSVVVQRARIIRARPRLDAWKLTFKLVYNEDYIEGNVLKKVIEEAGIKCGLCDFRPSSGGWFGTFKLIKFEELKS